MISASAGPQVAKSTFGQPVVPNLNIHLLCPNCREDPPNLVEEYAKGDIVCATCGTVLGDRIVDTRSEWRTFAGDENGDDPSRVGDAGNELLGNMFETTISSQDGRSGIARDLQRAQSRVAQTNGSKSHALLSQAFARINEKSELMQLPRSIVAGAQRAFKVAEDSKLIKGKDMDAAIAACIILGCREAGVDRSLPEVANVTKVNKKKIGRMLLAIGPVVNAHFGDRNPMAVASKGEQSTISLLARLVNFLDLGNEVHKAAKYIAEHANDQSGVTGRSPVSIAAGVLWFTVLLFGRDKEVSAKDIGSIAEVSESTTKFICKKIAAKMAAVVKPEWSTQPGYDSLVALGKSDVSGGKPSRSATPAEPPAVPALTPVTSGSTNATTNGAANGTTNGSTS